MVKFLQIILFLSFFYACMGKGNPPVDPPADVAHVDTLPTVRTFTIADIVLEKDFLYDRYTLTDTFPYRDTVRIFQFDKMRERLFLLDSIQQTPAQWAILQNRHNKNDEAPLVHQWVRNDYNNVSDMNGVQRYQSVPLYVPGDPVPSYYGRDGSPVKILGINADSSLYRIESFQVRGKWDVPVQYVKLIADTVVFRHAIMVDRINQDIATMEKSDGKWLIRSMNPATTGAHKPPYAHETPAGMFLIQEKKPRMLYTQDGRPDIAGYAPWASRFSNGGYLHGVPTNSPDAPIIEFSATLGTIPRSHMCVRNATSHAKFIYDWAPIEATVVFVYD